MKKAFSMFRFYKYLFTKDPKKYDMVMKEPYNIITALTPLPIAIISILASLLIGNPLIAIPFISFIVLNFVIFESVRTKGYYIEREAQYEKEEAERAERARRAWQEEQRRKREAEAERARRAEEAMRRVWERAQQRAERDRLWREEREREAQRRAYEQQYQQYYRQQFNQQQQQQQTNTVDQNMINAMKLLGLNKGFTEKDVKSAYRKLSKIHHPDMHTGTEENFKRLNKAYNYVMDRI